METTPTPTVDTSTPTPTVDTSTPTPTVDTSTPTPTVDTSTPTPTVDTNTIVIVYVEDPNNLITEVVVVEKNQTEGSVVIPLIN